MSDGVLEAGNIAEKKTESCLHEAWILIQGDLRLVYSHLGKGIVQITKMSISPSLVFNFNIM